MPTGSEVQVSNLGNIGAFPSFGNIEYLASNCAIGIQKDLWAQSREEGKEQGYKRGLVWWWPPLRSKIVKRINTNDQVIPEKMGLLNSRLREPITELIKLVEVPSVPMS